MLSLGADSQGPREQTVDGAAAGNQDFEPDHLGSVESVVPLLSTSDSHKYIACFSSKVPSFQLLKLQISQQ